MNLNWLYGPPNKRAYTLDSDDVIDIITRIHELDPLLSVTVTVNNFNASHIRVLKKPAEEIPKLDRVARRYLEISAKKSDGPGELVTGELFIPLRREGEPIITWGPPTDPDMQSTASAIERSIASGRRPHFHRRAISWKSAGIVALYAAALACWIWLQFSSPVPIPAIILGWITAVILLTVCRHYYRQYRDQSLVKRQPYNGHRILNETREQTQARQADERTKLKTAFITAVIVLPLTVLGTLATAGLTGALNLNPDHATGQVTSKPSP